MDNGLIFTDLGIRGLITQTCEPGYSSARKRYELLQERIAEMTGLSPGAAFVVAAIAEGLVLHRSTLDALVVSSRSTLYSNGRGFEVELDMPGGWRDRRILPGRVVDAIRANRGVVVRRRDLTEAATAIRSMFGDAAGENPLNAAIAAAQAWWFSRLPGPLFAHLTRRRPFQVLDRAARARVTHRQPQRCEPAAEDSYVCAMRQDLDGCFVQTGDLSVIEELVRNLGRIAREKRAKAEGLKVMGDVVDRLTPRAVRAGRAQTLVLGGVGFVLTHGGVRGAPLAPITAYEYCRQHLIGLTAALTKDGADSWGGERWLKEYKTLLHSVPPTQRGKLGAFLQAFHSFLVLIGIGRLPSSICSEQLSLPPASAVVTEHELRLALSFVRELADSQVIAAQASIALLLGFELELRTYELWCIRMVDVQLDGFPYVVIYPRRVDGACKTPSVRRQEDIRGPALLKLLVHFKRKRLTVDFADDDDLFFGVPGAPDQRQEQQKTMKLVNAALAWATGQRAASFYDLRHSTFSRKVKRILMDDQARITDVASFFQVSAEGGHAGPGSTLDYVHQIEEPLAFWFQKARPESWVGTAPHPLDAVIFPDVGQNLLLPARVAPPPKSADAAVEAGVAKRQPFEAYADITRRLARGEEVDEIAGRCTLSREAVLKALDTINRALADADLAADDEGTTVSRQVFEIWRHRTWIAAASHQKCAPIASKLAQMLSGAKEEQAAATAMWQAWVRCVHGRDLVLDRARPASQFIRFLLAAGVPRAALVVTAAQQDLPLPPHLASEKLSWRRCAPRAGAPRYRLSLVHTGVTARAAKARQVSVKGLNWLMVLAGAVLLTQEK